MKIEKVFFILICALMLMLAFAFPSPSGASVSDPPSVKRNFETFCLRIYPIEAAAVSDKIHTQRLSFSMLFNLIEKQYVFDKEYPQRI